MTPIIYINPMPESCGKCQFRLQWFEGQKLCAEWCDLLERLEPPDGVDDTSVIKYQNDYHPSCPLKPLVLCGECKHKGDYVANGVYWCEKWALMVKADHFCKDGVKA